MKKKFILTAAVGTILGLIGIGLSGRAEGPGQRLARILSARSNITTYVGEDGVSWEPVTTHTTTGVRTASRFWSFDDIRRFVVAYRSGELLDVEAPVELPDGTHYMQDAPPENFFLDQEQVSPTAAISFAESPTHPHDVTYYETTIINGSNLPMQVLRFGGFVPAGPGRWRLNNASGGFYSSSQFADWYDCPGGLIRLGQSVSDPTNYGPAPVLWAYEVQTGSERIWVGGGW